MSKLVYLTSCLGVAVVLALILTSEASPAVVGGNQWRIQSQDAGPCAAQLPRFAGISCMMYFDEWFYENGNCVLKGYSGCRSVGGFQSEFDCTRNCIIY